LRPVDFVLSKQDKEGMWELENAFNGRFQTSIEQEGKGSKFLLETETCI